MLHNHILRRPSLNSLVAHKGPADIYISISKTPTAMHRRPVTFLSFCIFCAFYGRENKPKGNKSFKYHATSIPNEVWNSFWGHLGPSCTNSPHSPQKLQVEVHCLSLERPKSGFVGTEWSFWHNAFWKPCILGWQNCWKVKSALNRGGRGCEKGNTIAVKD